MKRYICGFLIICLTLSSPYVLTADEPIIESTVEPVILPIEEPIVPPAPEPIVEPIVEPVVEPVIEPIVEPVVEPIVPPLVDPIVPPIVDPIAPPIVPAIVPSIVINEVMLGSEINPVKDVWIEFYNPTNQEIPLNGWQIRGVTSGGRWVDLVSDQSFSILPNSYFLLSYYTNSSYSALNVKPQATKSSLAFPNTTIDIELKNPNGEMIDKAFFECQTIDEFRSYERDCLYSDGSVAGNWSNSTAQTNLKTGLTKTFATPNSANSQCVTQNPEPQPNPTDTTNPTDNTPVSEDTNPQSTVSPPTQSPIAKTYPAYRLINELMVNPAGSDEVGEWIELFNGTSAAIDLSGWYLDDEEGSSTPYKIVDGTSIGASLFLVISAPDLNLAMKNSDDQIRILDPNKEVKEVIAYSDAQEGLAYAKKTDGTFAWTSFVTPGSLNSFPLPPKAYKPDDIIFKSVLPNPDGQDESAELITIKNNLNETVDLTGWKLTNQKNRDFSLNGIAIGPLQRYELNPININLSLVNKADQLSLIDPAGNLIDRINWTEAESGQIIYKPDYLEDGLKAKVTYVVDGDTFDAQIDGEEFRIRIIGINTPETVHPKKPIEKYGIEASNYLKNLLSNQTVTLNFDETKTDVYNRLLAYVYLGNNFINADILKNGYGYAYTRFPFKFENDFIKYEQEARDKKIGIWSDPEIIKLIDEIKNNPDDVGDDVNRPVDDEMDDDLPTTDATENQNPITDCPTEGIMIDSILPNAEKGISIEYIKLINTSNQTVCLDGWQIDDSQGEGSKPFQIKGGAIEPGAIRTFRKTETGISLNNSNDCASLINPSGTTADKICYAKTHKNEIFNHDGGNWQPAPPKAKSTNRATPAPKRETTDYEWELKNETIDGKIAFIYEEGQVMYLQTDKKMIPVSYANSKVNINSAKQMLDLNSPIKIDVRAAGEERELIGISQKPIRATESEDNNPRPTDNLPTEIKYFIGLIVIVGGLYLFKKLKNKQ